MNCNPLFRRDSPLHLCVSGLVVFPGQSAPSILTIFHEIFRDHSLPGGHVEKGEAPRDAVIREVLEETGLYCTHRYAQPISRDILPVKAHMRKGVGVREHRHLVLTYLLDPDLSQNLSPEKTRWITPEDLIKQTGEAHMVPYYEKLKTFLNTV